MGVVVVATTTIAAAAGRALDYCAYCKWKKEKKKGNSFDKRMN